MTGVDAGARNEDAGGGEAVTGGAGLEGTLPPEALLRGAEREPWRLPGGLPEVAALPGTAEEISAVLEGAAAEGRRAVPAGGGGGLAGSGLVLPERPGPVVVSTSRMDRIVEYEPGDLTVTAQAGITLKALGAATRNHGQWLPLEGWGDPDSTTLGALLATGGAGPLQAGFGTPRDHVLGLTLVAGDGRILRLGGRVVKNVAGYDLVRAVVGSRGRLGVVAEATMRLHPRPASDVTLLFRDDSAEALLDLARALATAPVLPAALELVDPAPDSDGAALAARVVGGTDAVEASLEELRRAGGRGEDGRLEGGEGEAWFRTALGTERSAPTVVRLALLPDRLDELLLTGRSIQGAAGGAGDSLLAIHATRGRLRVALPGVPPAEARDELVRALAEGRTALRADGGSLTLIRAPLDLRKAAGLAERSPTLARLEERIRAAFDSAGTLPGWEAPR